MNAPHHPRRACIAASSTRRPIPAVRPGSSANAGSGKTHVLAQRVIRLLLAGTDPRKYSASPSPRPRPPTWRTACSIRSRGWTTLDDAALDRQSAAIGVKRVDAKRAGAGAPAVRAGAGDARRPQGADHPRLLHAAAAAVSVRGQCRGALRGAGRDAQKQLLEEIRLERAARCGRGARRPARPRARRPIITLASDFAFQHASARRSASATRSTGMDRARRRHRRRHGGASQALGVDADDTVESVEPRCRRPLLPSPNGRR